MNVIGPGDTKALFHLRMIYQLMKFALPKDSLVMHFHDYYDFVRLIWIYTSFL